MEKRSRQFIAVAALVAIPLYSADAAAGDGSGDIFASSSEDTAPIHATRVLEGKYGWTGQQVCIQTVQSPPGSTDPITPTPPLTLNVPAQVIGATGVGTATFKANGTLRFEGTNINELIYNHVNTGDVPLIFDAQRHTCDGTYSIGSDNRAKVDFQLCTATTNTPGMTISTAPLNWDGWVADNGRTIDLNLKGTVQTETFLQGGNPVSVAQRVCTQREVFHKLPNWTGPQLNR